MFLKTLDLQKRSKNSTKFPYFFHLAYSNVNILHKHNALIKNQDINVGTILTEEQILLEFHQFLP